MPDHTPARVALIQAHKLATDAVLKATLQVIINHQWTRGLCYADFLEELRKSPGESRVYAMQHVGPVRFELLRKVFLSRENN